MLCIEVTFEVLKRVPNVIDVNFVLPYRSELMFSVFDVFKLERSMLVRESAKSVPADVPSRRFVQSFGANIASSEVEGVFESADMGAM